MADEGPFSLVWREFDARRMNAVLNDPDVRPQVADVPDGDIDVSGAVSNPVNVLLMGEHGGCLFLATQVGTYEVHTAVRACGRGAWAFQFTRQAVSWMFTQTDAIEIMTRIPGTHPGARMLAVKTGMRYEFTRYDHCLFMGEEVPVDIYSFRIQDWCPKAEGMKEVGARFHEQLITAVRESGNTGEPHPEDENHDQYLGACVLMIRASQVQKAAAIYNRWAIASRHQPVSILQISPPAFKFDAGTVVFLGDDIKVLAP